MPKCGVNRIIYTLPMIISVVGINRVSRSSIVISIE